MEDKLDANRNVAITGGWEVGSKKKTFCDACSSRDVGLRRSSAVHHIYKWPEKKRWNEEKEFVYATKVFKL